MRLWIPNYVSLCEHQIIFFVCVCQCVNGQYNSRVQDLHHLQWLTFKSPAYQLTSRLMTSTCMQRYGRDGTQCLALTNGMSVSSGLTLPLQCCRSVQRCFGPTFIPSRHWFRCTHLCCSRQGVLG